MHTLGWYSASTGVILPHDTNWNREDIVLSKTSPLQKTSAVLYDSVHIRLVLLNCMLKDE